MTSPNPPSCPIAIIGLGCRYPDARNPRELWENVLTQRQSFRRMPDERLPLSEYGDSDKNAPDKTYLERAAVIDGFEFDWARRRIPKQVYEQTDITHWLALDVALQALNDAGYEASELPRDRSGVVIGNTLTGEQQRAHLLRGRWPFVQKTIRAAGIKKGLDGATLEELVAETEKIYKSFFPAPNEDTLAGALSNTIAGRICNYMDLRGGGYTVDGACASSLLSVATAANALCAGDIDVALAGGVDVSLDAFEIVGFAKVGALTDSDMKVYDRAGNGFLPGEGCGFIVMKRLDDAKRDGDYVYAALNGWGVSSDGKGGITAPTVGGQALALRRAYDRAGYSAHELDFVEGHGTGTPVGDPVELSAISNTIDSFGEAEPHRCGVTSFKSLVGHTKAAAGIGGLLKAIAGVNRRVVPPTAGCDEPHEVFSTKARNLYPVRTGSVRNPTDTLTAGVSAMGFGGINSHVTVSSGHGPSRHLRPALDERAMLASKQATELFALQEESLGALERRAHDLSDVVAGMSVGEMPDLAADLASKLGGTGTARAAIVASSPKDLQERLATLVSAIQKSDGGDRASFVMPDRRVALSTGATRPKVGFLFPGQGSQRVNMARTLVERFDWARDLVAKADSWLEEVGVGPVSGLIYHDTDQDLEGEQQKRWMRALTQTEVAQPAICLASLLWVEFMHRLGLNPSAVGGHSLGELTAFHAAGALDQKSVLQLAALRGKLMGEVSVEGSMASLSCSPIEARQLIEWVNGYVVIANVNSPTQTVVSGDVEAVAAAIALATERGIRARELPVSAAFHSAHFSETVRELRDLPQVRGAATASKARLYSTMTGGSLEGPISLSEHFSEQVVRPVNFRSVAALASADCDVLLEVGPGAVLSGLTNETTGVGGTLCLPLEGKARRDQDLNIALGYLHILGAEIDLAKLWDQRHIRRFRSAAELSFFVNPCEKPVLDADVMATIDANEPHQAHVERSSNPVSRIRALSPDSGRTVQDSSRPGGSSLPPYVNAKAVFLDVLHKQTGFPIEALTDDLRMVDDLHMDSIKSVQVVVDAAVALGYAGDFDPAEVANSTLGEIAQDLERRMASAKKSRSGSISPTRAAAISESYPSWTRTFAMGWEDTLLPEQAHNFWENRSVCILDDGSDAATELWAMMRSKGSEVTAVPTVAASDSDSDVVIAILSDATKGADVKARFNNVTGVLSSIAKGLASSVSADTPRTIVFVQRCAEVVNNFDWGYDAFVAALHLERQGVHFRVLTVDESMDSEQLCAAIARETATDRAYDNAIYVGKTRRIARPQVIRRRALTARSQQLGADDVVIVTGGARGITAECALALARKTGARMVLAGSSPHPEDAPEAGSDSEIGKTLERFQHEGLRSEYVQCDVTDPEDVVRLVKAARRHKGHVAAVIHGAAINRPRRANKVSADEARKEISPKLVGALNLFDALHDDPPDIFCAFTSIIGVTGMPNNAWYAFANQALDRSLGAFAETHPEMTAISIAFSIWEEIGMGAKLGTVEGLAKLGTDAIPVEEGVSRFLDIFEHDAGERQLIVSGRLGGIDTWRPQLPVLPKGTRFLEDIRFHQPLVEICARSHLDLDRDAYLRDHRYKGSYLLPTVFGLEAMGQAVAYVLGRVNLPALSIHNVRLRKPILVDPTRGLTIEVNARVLDGESAAPEVHVSVRSEQTGYKSNHFDARFVLDANNDDARPFEPRHHPTKTNIDPRTDLYGSILFQGARFQRITWVTALSSDECSFTAQEAPEESYVLGDPYFRDALLQSLQLCALPDQCLPVQVERIDIIDPNRRDRVERDCTARIHERTEDAYAGSVTCADADGRIVEQLVGYHAKVIERRAEWPTAEELAARIGLRGSVVSNDAAKTRDWDGGTHYRDVPGYGPQNQMAFFMRFPLTAQESQGPHGTVNFTNYYRWAGKTRELGTINTPGAYPELINMLASQKLTAATNSFETKIFALPKPNDLIEVRYWAESVTRIDAGAIYEWWRVPFPPTTTPPEMIAWSKMKTSAVRILDDGRVVSSEWPEFFFQFLSAMGPRSDDPTPEPSPVLDMGNQLNASDGYGARHPVHEEVVHTTLEDANVVGNVYFANYGVWQGRARDRFLQRIAPELFSSSADKSMLHCLNTGTYHLREAMPFDSIGVRVYITALWERGIRLEFDFMQIGDRGPASKLARGFHEVAWVTQGGSGTPKPLPWPTGVRDLLMALTMEQAADRAAS